MQKFFVENKQISNNQITLIGDDVKHIINVLRMKKDEIIKVGNKETFENYLAQIEQINKESIMLKVIEKLETTVEPNVEIDLFQGLPKADKMEWVIQKTTELGISKIIPIEMSRCIVKLEQKEEKKKIERWQKVAKGAAEQSKRDKIPLIENKIKLQEVIQKIKKFDIFLVAYEEEKENTLKEELSKIEKKEKYQIGILIGPEGGISKEEVELLKQNGAKIITLGKRILRTETAPIAMVSNILYELEK